METRSAPRAHVNAEIAFFIDGGEEQKFHLPKNTKFPARLSSISVLGLSMICDKMLPKGLVIKLEVPGEPFLFQETMHIKGEVRYCRQVMLSEYNCGIKFLDIQRDHKDRIAAFVASHRKDVKHD